MAFLLIKNYTASNGRDKNFHRKVWCPILFPNCISRSSKLLHATMWSTPRQPPATNPNPESASPRPSLQHWQRNGGQHGPCRNGLGAMQPVSTCLGAFRIENDCGWKLKMRM